MSIASSASTSASVPFATPTVRGTPSCSAASCSNALTFGPRMKTPESSTPAIRSWICGIRRSYWALTFTRGVSGTTGVESREPPKEEVQHHERHSCHERDVEVVVEVLVVGPERIPDRGEGKGPGGRAGNRPPQVRPEPHLEHAGWDRDERAHDRGDAPEQDGPSVMPVEPALRSLEPAATEVEQARVPLGERPAAVAADAPAGDRADEIAERAGERHRHVRPTVRVDPVAEERDMLRRERAGGN